MKWVEPGSINGHLAAPPSKSIGVRAVAAALLARGHSRIENASFCDDALAAMDVITNLGATVSRAEGVVDIEPNTAPKSSVLNCGESGLTLRMFAAITALFDQEFTLTAQGSLCSRPMDMIKTPMVALGCQCSTTNGHAPIRIHGPLHGGNVEVDGSETSQFLTGLLMSLPLCDEDSQVVVYSLKSSPYIAVTLSLLRDFGIVVNASENLDCFDIPGGQSYTPCNYRVEGDWSGASFFLVAAALTGHVSMTDLDPSSTQADRAIVDALRLVGAEVAVSDTLITVRKKGLSAFDFDATDCPDLFPPLAVLALGCKGTSRITGVGRLFHKESDRASVLVSELGGIGGHISLDGDTMVIIGGRLSGGQVQAHGDHRIAMAMAVAGLISGQGVSISGWPCVSKSYPDFFNDLQRITEHV